MTAIAIIGHGAIARYVADRLRASETIVGVICRAGREAAATDALGGDIPAATGLEGLAERPRLVLDCAGHGALRDHGPGILGAGVDLITVSSGALADRALHDTLAGAARDGGGRLFVVPGAIGALDALAAARVGGLDRVVYRGRKPPLSWAGTPAEELHDLAALSETTVHFTGDAREAALRYPKNANVAASVALAGVGFEATIVELIADPSVDANIHEIEATGLFGTLSLRIEGRALPENPKSSALTAMSVVRAVETRTAPIVIG